VQPTLAHVEPTTARLAGAGGVFAVVGAHITLLAPWTRTHNPRICSG